MNTLCFKKARVCYALSYWAVFWLLSSHLTITCMLELYFPSWCVKGNLFVFWLTGCLALPHQNTLGCRSWLIGATAQENSRKRPAGSFCMYGELKVRWLPEGKLLGPLEDFLWGFILYYNGFLSLLLLDFGWLTKVYISFFYSMICRRLSHWGFNASLYLYWCFFWCNCSYGRILIVFSKAYFCVPGKRIIQLYLVVWFHMMVRESI